MNAARPIGALALVLVIGACSSGTNAGPPTTRAQPSTTVASATSPPSTNPSTRAASTTTPTSVAASTTAVPRLALAISGAKAFNDCHVPDSFDTSGATVSYGPANAYDGDPATAWRCQGHPPLGGRYGLTFTLSTPSRVTRVGAVPGYAKNDPRHPEIDRFVQNDRVFNARWSCNHADNSTAEKQQRFDDARTIQTIDVDWAGCVSVTFEVLDVYPAELQIVNTYQVPIDDTSVGEVTLDGSPGG